MKLKIKHSLSLIILTSLTISISAQKFNYGANMGTNFAIQSEIGDLYNNDEIKTGFHAGLFGSISMSENFSLQTEVNYDQKGSANENITNSYDYITIPVLAKWSLGKSLKTPIHFKVYTGPYTAFLINAESKISNPESSQITDNKDNSNNIELGALGGFGIFYPLKNNNIFLDFRFGLGLSPFDKTDDAPRNKYFGINLGFEF